MSASEWGVLVAAAAVVVLALVTVAQLVTLRRTVVALRDALEDLRGESLAAVTTLRRAVRETGAELDRVDAVLHAADAVGQTAEAASKLAYAAFGSPVVKVLAFGSGTRRAVRRLRGPEGGR